MDDLQIIKKYGKCFLPGLYEGRLIPHGPFLEEWKTIDGYENYEISNYGNLKNRYSKKYVGFQLSYGYKRTTIYSNKKSKMYVIHRLVALSFISNNENKPTVNHIRGVKTDNTFTQLEWATISENTLHGYKHLNRLRGNMKKIVGTHIETKEKIYFKSLAEAERNGFLRFRIRKSINNEVAYHKKYTWEYETN